MKIGDKVVFKNLNATVIEFYKHDNFALVSVDGINYRDFICKISDLEVLS